MGLAVRVIPTLLARGQQLVKGERFDSWRSVGHVQQAVRIHQARGVDELIVLDIGATPEGRGPDLEFIKQLTAECFMPITVGGGVRSLKDVEGLLRAGADKVAICSALFHHNLLEECAGRIGSQALVAAVDVSERHVRSNCGQQRWPLQPAHYARLLADAGAGEILLTDIEREGTLKGYNLDLIREVSDAVSVPVIAHGGAGSAHDMLLAVQAGASAAAAGALFQFCDITPAEVAFYLHQHGVEARHGEAGIGLS